MSYINLIYVCFGGLVFIPSFIQVRFEEESKKVFDGHEQYQPQHHGYHGQQDLAGHHHHGAVPGSAGHHHHGAVPGSYAEAHNQQPFNYILRSQQLSENVVNNRKKNISFV